MARVRVARTRGWGGGWGGRGRHNHCEKARLERQSPQWGYHVGGVGRPSQCEISTARDLEDKRGGAGRNMGCSSQGLSRPPWYIPLVAFLTLEPLLQLVVRWAVRNLFMRGGSSYQDLTAFPAKATKGGKVEIT